jgi:[ribosomal protein S18]-alanine N-acetyltransferase
MNQQIVIRNYKTDDWEAVMDLIKKNIPKYFAPEEESDFDFYIKNERELYYVLLYDEKIVGCGGINFEENKTIGKISWDILHPDYQGKSLGTQLLKFRIQKLHSIESIKKITVRTSQIAYLFYQKQGFELQEIIKNYWAKGFDLYKMEYKKMN